MERYVCIHAHFYQPPRENPWLEAIELQDSAYPYHDWNERIAAECYAPNANARILDGDGRIVRLVNNYARISFNFGPTLLSWLKDESPAVYEAILEADRESQGLFSGHGSALAQVYNHLIMPLANRRDKYTQVHWGIRDFEHRFGRKPEGMWLAETAVDVETLEVLAEHGVHFTVLSPYQAGRVRKTGARNWHDASSGKIDPTRAYAQRLPSGKRIALFFYDGPISRAVAFERLLVRGEDFANRLMGGFSDGRDWSQLVHIATDGETYGHHHRHGEMALAYALHHIESNQLARITNYGEYLEKHPPTHEAEIVENTAWSCVHGVDRWRRDCGCNSGMHGDWNQAWRAPLRQALDWLRDELAPRFEGLGRPLLKDPWAARDDYVEVILDRSPETVQSFMARHQTRPLNESEQGTVLKLMELQRHALLMYTSCGWFFDELTGIETMQVIQYASRALQLTRELTGHDPEPGFLERLQEARSNLADHGDGRQTYEKFVEPAMVDLPKVAAHYAVSSLFEDYPPKARIYSFEADQESRQSLEAGQARFVVGRARMTSRITREVSLLSYAVAHMGDHNIIGGVREFQGQEAFAALVEEGVSLFNRADFPELIRFLDRQFQASTYSLKSLFRDEQRKILNLILQSRLQAAEAAYRQLYQHEAAMLHFIADLRAPLPRPFLAAAEFILNVDLRRTFEDEALDLEQARSLLNQAGRWPGVELDAAGLAYALGHTIQRLATKLAAEPEDLDGLGRLAELVGFAGTTSFPVDLVETQNIYYRLSQTIQPQVRARSEQGDAQAASWLERFAALGERLSFRV